MAKRTPSIQLPARAFSSVLEIVHEYLCVLYKTFSNFIITTMKFDYHHYIEKFETNLKMYAKTRKYLMSLLIIFSRLIFHMSPIYSELNFYKQRLQ